MQVPKPRILALAALFVGLVAGSPVAAAAGGEVEAAQDSRYRYLSVYAEILSLVDRAYVEETDAQTLVLSSLEGLTDALDPFALYVPPAEVDAYLAAGAAAADRSGLLVLKERGVAYVVATEEGGPAARAEIRRGQIVKTIQGRSTREMPLWRIRRLLGAPAGTRLSLELLDQGRELDVQLELAEFERAGPSWRSVRGVGVLRVPGLRGQTASAIDAFLAGDAGERLVVDLRGVAGGDPEAAYALAERFARGELGALVGRHGALRRFASPLSGSGLPPLWTGRLAVLVDRGTLGAAEILATVLRQACGAKLVGERTFGHAGRIETIGLTSGARLELTGSFYTYTGPDGEPLDGSLEPDLAVRPALPPSGAGPDEVPPRDEVLERAVDLLLEEG